MLIPGVASVAPSTDEATAALAESSIDRHLGPASIPPVPAPLPLAAPVELPLVPPLEPPLAAAPLAVAPLVDRPVVAPLAVWLPLALPAELPLARPALLPLFSPLAAPVVPAPLDVPLVSTPLVGMTFEPLVVPLPVEPLVVPLLVAPLLVAPEPAEPSSSPVPDVCELPFVAASAGAYAMSSMPATSSHRTASAARGTMSKDRLSARARLAPLDLGIGALCTGPSLTMPPPGPSARLDAAKKVII
jgi:hypothetical protein